MSADKGPRNATLPANIYNNQTHNFSVVETNSIICLEEVFYFTQVANFFTDRCTYGQWCSSSAKCLRLLRAAPSVQQRAQDAGAAPFFGQRVRGENGKRRVSVHVTAAVDRALVRHQPRKKTWFSYKFGGKPASSELE